VCEVPTIRYPFKRHGHEMKSCHTFVITVVFARGKAGDDGRSKLRIYNARNLLNLL
jgi:hypothetical protein